ncbi:carboxylesterase [uncultured Selenomonas sp.]|uniref:alpha/beta hydrolase n=1 Tax=uncultured Selenomonas sp. TaxID=159275 RepID=UPI00260C650D|nr:alpha/beta fold hydrolase [uncultured Selenomonas sp.]
MIIEGAEPFLLPGGSHGVLLLHGFTGMPPEMRLLAEALHRAGHTVLCPRLAGHGTSPEDLAHTDAEDWYDSALDGYAILSGLVPCISVVGHSMGALLALRLAAQKRVTGVVTLAAPIFIDEGRGMKHLPPRSACIGRFHPKLRKALRDVPEFCNVTYDRMPLVAIHELVGFIEHVKALLPKVHAPLLLVHSLHDRTAHRRSLRYIYDHAGSAHKEVLWLVRSGHLVMLDAERRAVFRRTASFLRTCGAL